jgi:hypothetical protein
LFAFNFTLLYGCETWSLTLREELRVFENRVLRRIFGPKRDEVKRGWKNCIKRTFMILYSSPSKIITIKSKRKRWAGNVPRMGEKRNAYRFLAGNPEGRKPLGRPRHRWIEMDLGEIGWGGVTGLVWFGIWTSRELVNVVMNLRVP